MNCDAISRWYRWLEYAAFGTALQRRRGAFLREVGKARKALVLGDGDGRGLAALLRANPALSVDAIDSSATMLELARARVSSPRVSFFHADARTHSLTEAHYDLIVTHFFLDCFDDAEMERLVTRVARSATAEAKWLISEFRQPGPLVAVLYLFFRLTTGLRTRRLVDHRPLLAGHGFGLARSEEAWRGRLVSELWDRGAP